MDEVIAYLISYCNPSVRPIHYKVPCIKTFTELMKETGKIVYNVTKGKQVFLSERGANNEFELSRMVTLLNVESGKMRPVK